MKIFQWVCAIVFVIALMIALAVGTGVWRYVTAEFFGKVDEQVQLESAPNRIVQYNSFFEICSGVQSQKSTLDAQKRRLEMTDDEKIRNRIYANIAAIESNIARSVNKYNSMSQRHTQARFKDSKLPYRLTTEGVTLCE